MAFFKTPGTELLYSGVARIKPAASAMAFFHSAARLGTPSAVSTSPLYNGMPSILSILSSAPPGINSAAVRRSAVLNEPRRRLPEIPMIVGTVVFLSTTDETDHQISEIGKTKPVKTGSPLI